MTLPSERLRPGEGGGAKPAARARIIHLVVGAPGAPPRCEKLRIVARRGARALETCACAVLVCERWCKCRDLASSRARACGRRECGPRVCVRPREIKIGSSCTPVVKLVGAVAL